MTAPSFPRLRAVLADAGLDARVVDACAAHFGLVSKWNPTHNLTRVTGEEEAAVLHYLDCALPLLAWAADEGVPAAFADVGSGAGFPGLVAAMLWPTVPATLVEPARKRASFLQIAAGELGLTKVAVTAPSTSGAPAATAPLVLSRATFSSGLRAELWPYVGSGGALLAWTTRHERPMWEQEVATWPAASSTWRPTVFPTSSPRGAALQHGLFVVRRS